jgi:transposase
MDPEGKGKYVSVKQAAEMLNIHPSLVRRALEQGNRGLRGFQEMIEGQPRPVWRVEVESLKDFVRGVGGRPKGYSPKQETENEAADE